jgi:hypothetical protein
MNRTNMNDVLCTLVSSVAECLGGEYDLTSDRVPRIIFTCTQTIYDEAAGAKSEEEVRPISQPNGTKISVVYLASSQQWKAFWPFPATEQRKEYFTTLKELIDWLYEMGVDV